MEVFTLHFPHFQSQSTDMWRQTAVYEILNEILRNIPGLPWTYEDGQVNGSCLYLLLIACFAIL